MTSQRVWRYSLAGFGLADHSRRSHELDRLGGDVMSAAGFLLVQVVSAVTG